MELKINCDGGARGNPGPAASAFVVYGDNGQIIQQHGKFLGTATNNQAEYEAVLMAVNWLGQNYSRAETEFFLDSQLVVNQLNGQYKIKNPCLKIKYLEINKLISNFKLKIKSFIYIPREKNSLADSLVNQTLDNQFTV